MFASQLLLLICIFTLCVFLAYEDLRSAFVFLLLVSPLLHKEVFSLVRWDILPVRLTMLAILGTCLFKFLAWFRKYKDYQKIKEFLWDPMLILLICLLLVRIASLVNSKNLGSSLLLLSFFFTIVFLYVLISFLARRYSGKFIQACLKFYSFVAFGTAVVALLQFILNQKFGTIFGSLWRIPGKLPRVGSVFWDVNHYAGFLSSIIPITIGFAFASKSKTAKLFYLFMSVFMFAILILTGSRSAWIGLFVAAVILFTNVFITKFGLKKLTCVFVAALILVFAGVINYQNKNSVLREKINSYLHYRGDSFSSHSLLLEGAFEVYKTHPIIGGGYGSFFEHFIRTSVAADYYGRDPAALSVRVNSHSIWGEVISETGTLGLFVFVLILLVLFSTLLLASKKSSDDRLLFISMFASLFGLFVSGIFYSYNAEFFFIVVFLPFIMAKSTLGDSCSFNTVFSNIMNLKYFQFSIIFVLASLLIFSGLGKNHLIPWDEAIYAKVAKNMVKSQNFLAPFWEEKKVWFEKPPLYMWFSAISMKAFGFGNLGPKVPSAVFGLLAVLLVFLMGKKMFDIRVGFLSSVILLTTTQFLLYSRVGMLDVVLAFFILLSLYLYILAKDSNKALLWAASGIAAGLSVMTKGVVGFLVVPMIVASEVLSSRGLNAGDVSVLGFVKSRVRSYVIFLAAFLLAWIPWHLYMYLKFGQEFVKTYFGYHVLKRASESVEGKGASFFWYVTVLKVSMRVWFVALLAVLAIYFLSFVKRLNSAADSIFRRNAYQNYLFLWSFFVFLFFSIPVSKLVWYMMPIYPILSMFIGSYIIQILDLLFLKLKLSGKVWLMFVTYFAISAAGFVYLLNVRGLVYVPDTTGNVASLILLKDSKIGVDIPLYYDRIEPPLPMYYSNGKIVAVDYTPLVKYISSAGFGETIVYITKESRYQKLSKLFPNTVEVGRSQEYVLARVKSDKEILLTREGALKKEIEWLEEEADNNPEAKARFSELPKLREELKALQDKIEERSKATSTKSS